MCPVSVWLSHSACYTKPKEKTDQAGRVGVSSQLTLICYIPKHVRTKIRGHEEIDPTVPLSWYREKDEMYTSDSQFSFLTKQNSSESISSMKSCQHKQQPDIKWFPHCFLPVSWPHLCVHALWNQEWRHFMSCALFTVFYGNCPTAQLYCAVGQFELMFHIHADLIAPCLYSLNIKEFTLKQC